MVPGLPPLSPHSPEAHAIFGLWNETLGVCAVIFALVVGLVAYCVVRFRARGPHAPGSPEPPQIHGHKRLGIAWTAAPFVVVMVLFELTARTMGASDPP